MARQHSTKTLYVLSCKTQSRGSVFYVGASAAPARRLREHNGGSGGAWTRYWHRRGCTWQFQAAEVVCASSAGLHEDLHTLLLIRAHGVDRVRGGRFSQLILPPQRLAEIKHAMWYNDGCHHAAAGCPEKHLPVSTPIYKDLTVVLFTLIVVLTLTSFCV